MANDWKNPQIVDNYVKLLWTSWFAGCRKKTWTQQIISGFAAQAQSHMPSIPTRAQIKSNRQNSKNS